MALSLENANLVRQKVRAFTKNVAVRKGLDALFLHLSQLRVESLEWVPFSGTDVASDGGNADDVIADAACKIYAFYAKKRATATATWFKGTDHNTTASPTDPTFLHEFNAASLETFQVYPAGYSQGTGWTVEQSTDDISGSTRTLAADSVDGFYIIGAP